MLGCTSVDLQSLEKLTCSILVALAMQCSPAGDAVKVLKSFISYSATWVLPNDNASSTFGCKQASMLSISISCASGPCYSCMTFMPKCRAVQHALSMLPCKRPSRSQDVAATQPFVLQSNVEVYALQTMGSSEVYGQQTVPHWQGPSEPESGVSFGMQWCSTL